MPDEAPPSLRKEAERLITALNARDFEAIAAIELLDPEFEFHSALSAVEGQYHVGVSGLREWAEQMDAVWADFRTEIVDFRELQDGRVLLIYNATGTARGSGMPLDTRTAQIWTLRDGRLTHNQSYTDPAEALAAAGVSG